MTTPVVLRASQRDEIIAHAREEAPNECCGLLVGKGSAIDECVRARNLLASPTRYLLDPADHVAAIRRLRGSDRSVIGAYHSHPSSPALPSATDRAEIFYSDFLWVIVSLLDPEGEVAAFRLSGGDLTALPILLEP
jgi:proteasome lid subunit RPN8/RPN11